MNSSTTNPTYLEMYNKIVGAYMRNELNPFKPCACFIGNMLNGKSGWACARSFDENGRGHKEIYFFSEETIKQSNLALEEVNSFYTIEDIIYLEDLFLNTLHNKWIKMYPFEVKMLHDYEDRLFRAMEVTLEALKELHIEKGEVVENPIFTKRQLVVA